MHRIRREAERQGLEVILSPVFRPGPRTLRLFAYDVRQHVRELVAVAWYACSARLAAALERPWGRITRAAVVHLKARTRSLAGGADAVADASDTLAELIKGRVAGFSDTGAVLTPATARLPWPVRGAVLSRFGLRHRRLHAGVDIRAGYGTPICAAAGGHVLFAGWLGPYGNVTVIDHGGGLATVYAHQAGFLVQEGAAVTSGQMIGFIGATGKSSSAHLHFEVRVHGTPIDPLVYLS
jgi:murein DD-endopeptidase MepM/ murein hydrolase activator NlpD